RGGHGRCGDECDEVEGGGRPAERRAAGAGRETAWAGEARRLRKGGRAGGGGGEVRAQAAFFFHGEDGIRDWSVTGVQTCALPISLELHDAARGAEQIRVRGSDGLSGFGEIEVHRGGVEDRRRHLRPHEALPDELVELEVVFL